MFSALIYVYTSSEVLNFHQGHLGWPNKELTNAIVRDFFFFIKQPFWWRKMKEQQNNLISSWFFTQMNCDFI